MERPPYRTLHSLPPSLPLSLPPSFPGIEFVTGTHVGKDLAIEDLRANVDALVLTLGSTVPRDLRVPNREVPSFPPSLPPSFPSSPPPSFSPTPLGQYPIHRRLLSLAFVKEVVKCPSRPSSPLSLPP
ncbi:putative glutamate synthase, partial [Nannochloropsis gaditana]